MTLHQSNDQLAADIVEPNLDLDIRIWGARGSLPASGPDFVRYGGETCAVEVQAGAHTLVFDAGTGAVAMGQSLRERGVKKIDIFLTHAHNDHVMGLPFFAPMRDPQARIRIFVGGSSAEAETDAQACARLDDFFRHPFFPVGLDVFPAELSVHAMPSTVFSPANGLHVTPAALNHPGGATGFRLRHHHSTFAYVTDFEQDGSTGDAAAIELMADADLALLDATLLPGEYELAKGWGHAHWLAASQLADRAGVGRFGLFHHRHDRTDHELEKIKTQVTHRFPKAFIAGTGQRYCLRQLHRSVVHSM